MTIYDPLVIPLKSSAGGPVWNGQKDVQVLFVNQDSANTIYIGYRSTIGIGNPNAVPLQPGRSVVMDGSAAIYAVAAAGTVPLVIIPGATNFFQPTARITAGQFVAVGANSGIFVYSGTPALGNLVATIVPQAGTDPYGNAYGAGISSFGGAGSAAQITSAVIGLFSGLNVISEITSQGFFLYSPAGGLGNLVASISPAAGTDSFGNAFKAGVTTYGASGTFAQLFGPNAIVGDTVSWDFGAATVAGLHYVTVGSVTGSTGLVWIDQAGTLHAGNGLNGLGAPEGWHTLGALAAGSGYTVNNGRFQLDPAGFCNVDINLVAGAATVAGNYAFANAMSAGYQPPFQCSYPLGFNGTTAAGVNTTTLRVSTGGVVTLQLPVLPNGTVVSATQRIPTS